MNNIYCNASNMVVVNKLKLPKELKEEKQPEKDWNNPADPEKAEDSRDVEQLVRQKKEAERRKRNLSDKPEDTK
jgi:hypothetical protein